MNILVFSWRDPKHPLAGGAEQVMHEHMKGWIKAGHRVALFSSRFKNSEPNDVIDNVKIIRKGNQILGVQVMAFFWYLFWKHEKYDLIIDQFHGIPFFTPLYIKKPIIAVLQEVAKKAWLKNDLPRPLNWILGGIGYVFEPLFFTFYKKVPFITGSESAAVDLMEMGIDKKNINIIHHGVIIERPKPMPKKEKTKTIIFLGALAKDKGIEDAIKTFEILNRKDKYKFWIVGKCGEPYLKYLERLVKNLRLKDKTKFFGFVSQEEKKFELLARAHILINPSLIEGWGLVNIEANAMGTPVVAYKSRGLTDSVRDGKSGLFADENTPQSLALKIEFLLSDLKEYKKLSQSAIFWSRNFLDWDKARKKSIALIKETVKNEI
jgi:glycosyltransferase involved in cell wall biosynthesis